MRLVLRSKRRIRARLFPLIEDSIYKRRSTGDTQVALTDTIYEKVRRSSFFYFRPPAIRFALKKAGEREEQLSMVVKLDQVRRMNLYLCTVRKLLAGGRSTVRAQYSGGWFRFDKGRMPGRRSSTVGSRRVRFGSRARTRKRRCTILAAMYVNLDLRDSSNGTHTQRRTTSSGLDETENISIKKLTYWVSRASFFLVDQFASALLKGLHSYGGFVNERIRYRYGKGFLPQWNRWNALLPAKYTELGLPFVPPLPLFYSDLSFLLCFLVSSILLCLQPVFELYPVLPLACPEDLLSKVDLITVRFKSSSIGWIYMLRGDGKVERIEILSRHALGIDHLPNYMVLPLRTDERGWNQENEEVSLRERESALSLSDCIVERLHQLLGCSSSPLSPSFI
ncbi:hypothetical protein VNO80_35200 [Phaseolus coccineus]|uniref:Uncharacterized protein n=2 Tax=Phaseoleae TaxID=163735 RepID=A0AAN9KSF6_PHACN